MKPVCLVIGAGAGIGTVFGSLILGISRNPSLRQELFRVAILSNESDIDSFNVLISSFVIPISSVVSVSAAEQLVVDNYYTYREEMVKSLTESDDEDDDDEEEYNEILLDESDDDTPTYH